MAIAIFGVALAVVMTAMVPDDELRWPTWPTEVSHAAAALHDSGRDRPDERMRVRALQSLESYATAAIVDEIVHALDDPSPQVRAAALQLCYEREIRACLPAAANLWNDGSTPLVRMATLKVIALDPAPSRAAILLGALRDSDDQIRARAAGLLGSAPLEPAVRRRARAALLAKLTDVSSVVRREATHSLGLLGRASGTLAIARLLDDPDPGVRAAAAEALGQHRDARAVPALLRTVAMSSETEVSQAAIDALALLPSPQVDRALLRLLDTPPPGLTSARIAAAIGRRPNPGAALTQGLIDRLQEEDTRAAALAALLHLGAQAAPELREARRRGLAPSLDIEVERLLGAIDLPARPTAVGPAHPLPADRSAWHETLGPGLLRARIVAAVQLAKLAPPWLDDAVAGRFEQVQAPDLWLPWALVVAQTERPMLTLPRHRLAWARLVGWAQGSDLAARHRCLAMAATAAAPANVVNELVGPALERLRRDADPRIRTCAVLASARARADATLSWAAAALRDPNARVRTAGALAVAAQGAKRPAAITSLLAVLRYHDSHASVRLAATWALEPATRTTSLRAPWLATLDTPPYGWATPLDFLTIQVGDQQLTIPAEGDGAVRWSLVPGLPPEAEVLPPAARPETPTD